jgi:hypothetical protein
MRVERSESLDEREASARMIGVMAERSCEGRPTGSAIRRSDAMLSFLVAVAGDVLAGEIREIAAGLGAS